MSVIIVHVEHHLNEAGRIYFPQWLSEIADVLRNVEGFETIAQLVDIEDENACHLLLEFEGLVLLRAWSKSEAHDEMTGRLEPYRLKKQRSKVFEKRPNM